MSHLDNSPVDSPLEADDLRIADLPPDEFDAWLAAQAEPDNGPSPSFDSPIPPPPMPPSRGYGHQAANGAAVVSQAEIAAAFEGMANAPKYGPVPSGEYVCRVLGGEFCRSRVKATPGFKVAFQIIEGEFAGRRVWFDVWLTGPGLASRERELKALGITNRERMVENMPPILVDVRVVQRQSEAGVFFNEVARDGIRFVGFAEPSAAAETVDAEPDPFDVDAEPKGDQAAEPQDVQDLSEGEGQ